jgi:uncharacterized repeat protein (TIGR01451 family)
VVIVDPTIVKLGDPRFAQPGERVTWTVTVTNPNPVPVNNVIVVDPVPYPFIVEGAETDQGTFTISGSTVTFFIGTLAPGQTVTMRVFTRVDPAAIPPIDATNTVEMTWDGGGKRFASDTVSIIRDSGRGAAGAPARLPETGQRPPNTSATNEGLLVGAVLVMMVSVGVYLLRRQRRRRAGN